MDLDSRNQNNRLVQELHDARNDITVERNVLQAVLDNTADAVVVIDRQGTVVRANQAAERIFGLSSQCPPKAAVLYASTNEMNVVLDMVHREGRVSDFETTMRTAGNTRFPAALSVSLVSGADGDSAGSVMVIKDLSRSKALERQITELSFYDRLTGLYNRDMFEQQMRRLESDRFLPISLIVCDVDGLKIINDSLGHKQGDRLLKAAAAILTRCFRSTDILARIGGDEFAVLLPACSEEVVRECRARLLDEVERYNRRGPDFELSLSSGYAVVQTIPVDLKALFKQADDNVHKVKLQKNHSAHSATVQALIKILETRDDITGGHGERLQNYAQKFGRVLQLPDERITDLNMLGQFHDLGKVGIPDSILFKPGPLNAQEYETMKRHSEIGHKIATSTSDLAPIADLILKHHEWWNGNGYPLGLAGEEIPIECRILALVDAYDAMTSERPYKEPMSHSQAVDELRRCAGSQFDPELVEMFIWVL